VVRWIDQQPLEATCISVLTIGELESDIAQLHDEIAAHRFRVWLEYEVKPAFTDRVIPFGFHATTSWGQLRGTSARVGRTLPTVDSMLAATAMVHDLVLVTRNTSDFDGLPVRVFNPWLAQPELKISRTSSCKTPFVPNASRP
jgi:toxin FitB